MGFFGKSGLQGLPPRAAPLFGTFSCTQHMRVYIVGVSCEWGGRDGARLAVSGLVTPSKV